MDRYTIASDRLQVGIKTHGAELCELRSGGRDYLWSGDPAIWGRQAPNLFPIVGTLKDDQLVHQGRSYPMPRHGFARDRAWELVRLSGHSCTLCLREDAQSLAQYPFPFTLTLTARVEGPAVRLQYELLNPGEAPLFASLGAHPAFRWPLAKGIPRQAHHLDFEKPESPTLPSLDPSGLITAQRRPSPLQGRRLPLSEDLFDEDALLFLSAQSRAVRFSAPSSPSLEVSWEGFPDLAVWAKPGAPFLCIEPWLGHASPQDFQGEFSQKPGVFQVAPGKSVTAAYTVRILTAD